MFTLLLEVPFWYREAFAPYVVFTLVPDMKVMEKSLHTLALMTCVNFTPATRLTVKYNRVNMSNTVVRFIWKMENGKQFVASVSSVPTGLGVYVPLHIG